MSNISSLGSKKVNPEHQFIVPGEIQTAFGFFKFYFENLRMYPDKVTCFDYCNNYFFQQYGYLRYNNFSQFSGGDFVVISQSVPVKIIEKKVLPSSVEVMERDFLLAWFKGKGFGAWISFKSVVMHYYSEQLNENDLWLFWNSKSVDANCLKYVDYVRQILG